MKNALRISLLLIALLFLLAWRFRARAASAGRAGAVR